MNQASEEITVIVRTPLKRNGKRVAPGTELDMTIAEAAPLLEVQAVLARDYSIPHDATANDPDGTAPGAAGEAGENGGGSDDGKGAGAPPAPDGPLNINSATAEQLAGVSGLGEELAKAIVAHREANGAYESLAGLEAISGIGAAKVKKLADRLTV